MQAPILHIIFIHKEDLNTQYFFAKTLTFKEAIEHSIARDEKDYIAHYI